MGEQLAPGIKVTRQASQIRTIEGVGTSVGAFEGLAEKGPIGEATLIISWSDFVDRFGSYVSYSYLAYAVFGFFLNGGSRCYVVRTGHYDDVTTGTLDATDNAKASVTLNDHDGTPTLLVEASSEGDWANYVASPPAGINLVVGRHGPWDSTSHFTMDVYFEGDQVERFTYMTMDDTDSNYCEAQINGVSGYIRITDLGSATTPPDNQPMDITATLTGGIYDYAAVTSTDYIGDSAGGCGIYAFDAIDEINLLSVPGVTAVAVQSAIIDYCELRSANADGVFGVIDPPDNYSTTQVRDHRMNNFASEYAAMHWPWLKILDARTGREMYVPPSGHMQGLYSAVAQNPGVYQVPAGVEYGRLRGVLGLRYEPGDQDISVLNPVGVNSIRWLQGSGICNWGARTMTPDNDFKYINVSRYFLYVEESIEEGTRWAVFQPNDSTLQRQIRLAIESFLYDEWKTSRAISGETKDEAFFVVCDSSNNPPTSVARGKLYVDIGIAATKPAEFIHIRIGQWDGGASVEILKREQARKYTS